MKCRLHVPIGTAVRRFTGLADACWRRIASLSLVVKLGSKVDV